MKIALIGYGKMGKTIERIAKERGHEIVCIIDVDNRDDFKSEAFKSAQVAIEFTAPQVATDNYRAAWQAGVPVVSGTTGWHEQFSEIKQEIDDNGYTLFWASNFSLGVNIFMEINRYLAKIMDHYPDYNISMREVHHTQKLDAPSGTAITLADDIIKNVARKTNWVKEDETKPEELAIHSIREGEVPGIHTIRYENSIDSIEISHEAKSREGLALGAVMAAEFTLDKKGLLGMNDMLKF